MEMLPSSRRVRRRRIWGHPARQMCPVPQGVGRDPIADNSSWEPDLRAPVVTLARFIGTDRLMDPYR
jgi:hypothetical protein